MKENEALFKYKLAIVTCIKNEGEYIKEWLDYHLLAGVEHFYIYDNNSEDNTKEILQPYIDKNIVDHISFPNDSTQMTIYYQAIQNYKFFCRYLAFIDVGEFIFPRNNKTILEIINEILDIRPLAASLFVKGNYDNAHVKLICNPRFIDIMLTPYSCNHFLDMYACDENGKVVMNDVHNDFPGSKIVINNYKTKNYDNEILQYIELRKSIYEEKIETLQESANRRFNEIFNVLSPIAIFTHLSTDALNTAPKDFFMNKIHVFLTCLSIINELKSIMLDKADSTYLEETLLKCIYNSLSYEGGGMDACQLQILVRELPNILSLQYPVVNDIKKICIKFIPQLMNFKQMRSEWSDYRQLDYTLKILQND